MLRWTLPTVLGQTSKPIEIIVVDNGSTDETSSLISRDFPCVKLISEPLAGEGHARTTGMRAAKGDYVAFLDADDFWRPNHIEVLRQVALQFPDAGLIASSGGRRRIPLQRLARHPLNRGDSRKFSKALTIGKRIQKVDLLRTTAGGRNRHAVCSSTAAVRRDIVERHNLQFGNSRVNADLIFWHSMSFIADTAISPARTAYISRHSDSISSSSKNRESIEVLCDAYTRQPVVQHLVSNYDALPRDLQVSAKRYLDGVLTGAWRSTLYLGLQSCAREAVSNLHFARSPQAILFQMSARIPQPIASLVASTMQRIRPLDRFYVPNSPFFEPRT